MSNLSNLVLRTCTAGSIRSARSLAMFCFIILTKSPMILLCVNIENNLKPDFSFTIQDSFWGPKFRSFVRR